MAAKKNIVICSDGTGNTAIKGRGTNVFKMFEAVDIYGHWIDSRIPLQVAIYDDGVGTGGIRLWRLFCGMSGWGLSRNIRQLYTELVHIYEPGDNIYLFGFSRGAFTVRSLAGFIGTCGIIDREKLKTNVIDKLVKEAYKTYRGTFYMSKKKLKVGREKADLFRRTHSVLHNEHAPDGKAKIRFIGVWDTVDAVGLPIDELAYLLNQCFRFKFPDYVLRDHVQKACHALSIDDERRTFYPLMWDETNEVKEEEGREARIEQVWFPGVHSNVGGGYPKQGMSLISLFWIMKKAERAGLHFVDCDLHLVVDHQNPYDKLYDSRARWGAYYRYKPRDIGQMCRDHNTKPKIHLSALERVIQGTDGYAPGNIPSGCQFVDSNFEAPPENLAASSQEISSALKGKGSLLESVQWWIDIRSFAHGVLLVSSIATLLMLWWVDNCRNIFSNPLSWSWFVNLGHCLMLNPIRNLVVFIIIVISYTEGRKARQHMVEKFSEFWHAVNPSLRNKLYPAEKRGEN